MDSLLTAQNPNHDRKDVTYLIYEFLPSCGCITTIVWMHCMDANKIYREKDWWEQNKNATSYFEQILEATLQETTAVLVIYF